MYESGNDDLNKRYFKALKGGAAPIETGFRVWESSDESEYISAADAGPIEYKLHDFGFRLKED